MTEKEYKAAVIGMVDRNYDYDQTVDAAVEQGLEVTRRRSPELLREKGPGIGFFAGTVATHAVFRAVKSVEGVSSLEYDRPVYAAD